MTPLHLAVAMLAGWRLASFLTQEVGPFDVLDRFRTLIGVDPVAPHAEQRTQIGKLFTCMWCMTPWAAAVCFGLWYVHPIIPGLLAAAAGAILLERAAPR